MRVLSENLCYSCLHYDCCENECKIYGELYETDDNGNILYVTDCDSYK